MQYSRLRLLQEAFHDFNLLKVTGHVRGQHHLHHQSSKFSERANSRRIQPASHPQWGETGLVWKRWGKLCPPSSLGLSDMFHIQMCIHQRLFQASFPVFIVPSPLCSCASHPLVLYSLFITYIITYLFCSVKLLFLVYCSFLMHHSVSLSQDNKVCFFSRDNPLIYIDLGAVRSRCVPDGGAAGQSPVRFQSESSVSPV